MIDARTALAELPFNPVIAPDDVWAPSMFHVDLHAEVVAMLAAGLRDVAGSRDASRVGVVLRGAKGTGKTHLLAWTRAQVQQLDGYFFLVDLSASTDFWSRTVQSVIDGLWRSMAGGDTQLRVLIRRLSAMLWLPEDQRDELLGDAPLSRATLDAFVLALRDREPQVGHQCQDVARALALIGSRDFSAESVGRDYLQSIDDEAVPGERAAWGIRRTKPPQEVMRDFSRLVALTGPTVIAVDQLDQLVTQAGRAVAESDGAGLSAAAAAPLAQVGGGLMDLHALSRRTLTVISCQPNSWALILGAATDSVGDRFRMPPPLNTVPSAEIGRALVEQRLGAHYESVGFDPDYPSWPIKAEAFAEAQNFTPRRLLMRLEAHVQQCLRSGRIIELERLEEPVEQQAVTTPAVVDLGRLDSRFQALRRAADIDGALDPAREDAVMPGLLKAALDAWVEERDEDPPRYEQDAPPSTKPPLHARLRLVLDEEIEDEIHWAFRAIAGKHHSTVLRQIRDARSAGGPAGPRKLILLRNIAWSRGRVTAEVLREFRAAGGVELVVTAEDLRTFAALRQLRAENDPDLHAWLVSRRPAGGSELLTAALADAPPPPDRPAPLPPDPQPGPPDRRPGPQDHPPGLSDRWTESGREHGAAREPEPGEWEAGPVGRHAGADGGDADEDGRPMVPLGERVGGGQARVALEALRKHTAIFAGSGSGKTVLIRRLIEECALLGVSTIVLDPNNDLARLGDAWPAPPQGWSPEDPDRAARYLAGTEVVVWTPGRESGRPVTFQPLPDFRRVRDDPDELQAAVDAAVASLAPRVRADANTVKAQHALAVLRETVTYFARAGGSGLPALIALLAELPDGVSTIAGATKAAAALAEALQVAMVNDRLFGGTGTPVDPAVLLTPSPGHRARVSVINFVGLPDIEHQQGFVNQLQMAMFSWIKQNPAGDRPLGGLLVMDEAQNFAPSGGMTACTESTLALASQARKYGLGLVFATQAPKGLHNRIPGNAATQFYGFLNSFTQIDAVKNLARAKGSDVPDISRLHRGQFYAALEGGGFERLTAPMCLSHHPPSPLTTEEVLDRASGRRR
jgi:hypothetical protein